MDHHIVEHHYGANPGAIHMEADALPVDVISITGPCASAEEAWATYWTLYHPIQQFDAADPISKATRSGQS